MPDTCFWFDEVACIETCGGDAGPVIPPYGDFIQRAELTGPGTIDYFGLYVAIDGETAMISVSKDPDPDEELADESLNTVVYTRSGETWTEGATLSETQTMQVRQVTGDLAIFTTYDGVDTGGVYVYQRSEGAWSKLQQLDEPNIDSDAITALTAAMSPDGEWLAVGYYNATEIATNPGYVLMYQWTGTNFAYTGRIDSPNSPGPHEQFGAAISMSQAGIMVIGAYNNDNAGSNDGAAYIYAESGGTWSLSQTITPTVNESSTGFGHSVGITADAAYLVVGDRRSGASIYELDGTYSYIDRMDPGGTGNARAFISDDGLTVIQQTDPFGVDSTQYVNEWDSDLLEYSQTQSFQPDHPDLATVWVSIYGRDFRNGYLIHGAAEHETGDGLVDGPGYVYIYSRDPIEEP